jgi:hypothetical protein
MLRRSHVGDHERASEAGDDRRFVDGGSLEAADTLPCASSCRCSNRALTGSALRLTDA